VNIDDQSPVVPVFDSGPFAVGVESCDQASGDIEQAVGWLAAAGPNAQQVDQVRTEGDSFRTSALGDCGGQTDDRDRSVEIQVGDFQLPDFADSQAGPRQEGV
jgi:hypothetical protein